MVNTHKSNMSETDVTEKAKKPPRGPRIPKMTSEQREELDALVPECLSWNPEKVAKWIEDIGFPQYKVL